MEIAGMIGMLGVCSLDDIRRRQVKTISLLLFGILGLIIHMFYAKNSLWDMLGGMMIGTVLMIIAQLSKEKIGKGDALIIIVTGIYLGFWKNLILLWIATCFVGITGMILFFLGKRKAEIPFVPYILVAYLMILYMERIGNVL